MPLTLTPSDLHPNPQRKLQLRCGQAVRLYSTSGASEEFPVVGEFQKCTGAWCAAKWKLDGRYYGNSLSDLDVIEAPPALVTYTFQCEEGKAPLVFVPTGEVRRPIRGDLYVDGGGSIVAAGIGTISEHKILKPLTPERAT